MACVTDEPNHVGESQLLMLWEMSYEYKTSVHQLLVWMPLSVHLEPIDTNTWINIACQLKSMALLKLEGVGRDLQEIYIASCMVYTCTCRCTNFGYTENPSTIDTTGTNGYTGVFLTPGSYKLPSSQKWAVLSWGSTRWLLGKEWNCT